MAARPIQIIAGLVVLACAALAAVLLWPARTAQPPAGQAPPGLAALLSELPAEGFRRPEGSGPPDLPGDHAPHPGARVESWSVATHLTDDAGAPLAVQLVLTRVGLVPPGQAATGWRARAVWRGHVALLPDARGPAVAEERFVRAPAGLPPPDPASRAVRLDDWRLDFDAAGTLEMAATVAGRTLALTLTPEKPPVAAGAGQGGGPVRGYALTRLAAAGTVDGRAVAGSGWLDHAWGELPLPGGPVAFDRLLVHLADGRDLSLTRTRRRDGRGTPTLAGRLVHPDGRAEALDGAALSLTVQRRWQGPDGAAWPVVWAVDGPDTALDIAPVADDQVLDFVAPVWSGLVTAEGRLAGAPASGRGTLQLTGYSP